MEYPIKVCKFYKSGTDATFCKNCKVCVGYCEIDSKECKKPLLCLHNQKDGICPRYNKTEVQLEELHLMTIKNKVKEG